MPPTFRSADFQAMIECAPEPVMVYNSETFLYLNPAAAERLGADAATLVGRPVMDFVHAKSRQLVIDRFRQLAETGVPLPPVDMFFVSLSGSVIPGELMAVPIVFDGRPAILGLVRDIGKRLEAERALRESEELFATAFQHSPLGMAFVSLEGRWLRTNKSLCELLGYTEEELGKSDFQSVSHPEDLAEDMALLARLISGEITNYTRVKRYYRKDSRMIWVSVAVTSIHDDSGRPIYFICQAQDITSQRHAEQRRLQAERLGGIAETTVAVAHEMNNVLTALTMNAELLAHDASPEEVPSLAAEVLSASNRIGAIVKRLRNIADLKSVDYLGDQKMLDLSSGSHKAPTPR
jgi:PAS domain S-box-containing protein